MKAHTSESGASPGSAPEVATVTVAAFVAAGAGGGANLRATYMAMLRRPFSSAFVAVASHSAVVIKLRS